MTDRFHDLRAEYQGRGLETALPDSPLELLDSWLREAEDAGIPLANAMVLATADGDQPAARMVLLKNIDDRGRLWFFTNYESAKARALEVNPRAALLFYWEPLHRQIRINGSTERLAAADSDAYFATRPRSSNLAAMTSAQSQVLEGGPEQLARELADTTERWHDRELERPATWGGYALIPAAFEFWQGKQDRLHHRVRYAAAEGGWTRAWLYP